MLGMTFPILAVETAFHFLVKKPDERGGQINVDDLDRNLPQINMPVGAVDLEKVDIHFEG
jgi:hypothetical protein